MNTYKIIAGMDNQSGEVGLAFEDLPAIDHDFSMGDGRLLAHDLLEHQNGLEAIGGIGEELQALGGIWFVRGQQSDIVRTPNVNAPYQHLASDVYRMAMDYAMGEEFDCPFAHGYAGEDEFEDDYKDIIREAVSVFRKEYDNDFDHDQKQRLKKYWQNVKPFMRQGMAKAQERYQDDSAIANTLFWNVAAVVDDLTYEEGHEFTLTVNYETGEASIEEFYQESCEKCFYGVEGNEGKHTDSGFYCDECYGETFGKCEECNEEFEKEEDKTHCNYCFTE